MSQSSNGKGTPELLLARARCGDEEALGDLLELYRNYLSFIGHDQIRTTLKRGFNCSTLVQETYLDACRDFQKFRGNTERELLVWLRQILVRNLVDLARYHLAKKRDVRRLRALERILTQSSDALHNKLSAGISTPSSQVAKREQAVLVTDGLAQLPEHYREVIELRILDGIPSAEVAEQLGLSDGVVRKRLPRALIKLRKVMKELE